MEGLIYAHRQPIESIRVAGPVDRIRFAEAKKLRHWRPAKVGERFGPHWATHWFRLDARVPAAWAGRRVDLLWDSNSEATLWVDGRSVQGLNTQHGGLRPDAILLRKARGGERLALHVEMACNKKFGITATGGHHQAVEEAYQLARCELAAFDPAAWKLYFDFAFLVDLEADLARTGSDPVRSGELLSGLNRFANIFCENDRSTWNAAGESLKPLYARKNATTTHEVSAIGHAHIDTAWLWPLAETWRKCERTFSSQTAYMLDYPEYKFACSQAYQYDVIKARNPDLYARIKAAAKKGQWVPVGGTWIEPDCNIPSGEALVRQFLFGQRFFQREFGRRCNEFWNPDVFGYNGQLPQIIRGAGMTRFLTQKLSWNRFTKPPHHTFLWQGIDGSEVLAHFPPADTYNADCSVRELRHSVSNYKDHDRSRESYYLFGWGDGGGGPTKRMLEYLRRCGDVQGMPRVAIRDSDSFFGRLEKDCDDLPTIVGELYFELHRGTYTTQGRVKRGNRKSEILLHELEFMATAAWLADRQARAYPHEAINRLWQTVLLNQFHDILPGSSITQVYDDAHRDYDRVARDGEALRRQLLDRASTVGEPGRLPAAINTTGFPRREVVSLGRGRLVVVEAPPYGAGRLIEPTDAVSIAPTASGWVLENACLRAEIRRQGDVASLVEKSTGREALAWNANVFELYDDQPTMWEAWDVDPFHLESGRACGPAGSARVVTQSPLRAEIRFEHTIGRASRLVQTIRLDAHARRLEVHCDVEWQESRKFLKVAIPVNVRAMNATYEMQFGSVERPTHFNTPADLARYEVPLHKWADLGEHGFGVAVLSESKYGFSTLGNVMRLSLLRATHHPDPSADRGRHQFAYAIYPHAGDWRDAGVVAEGYAFNLPLLPVAGGATRGLAAGSSLASVDSPDLVIDTIKKAEDDDSVILRLYECHGGRGVARLRVGFPARWAVPCNLLEEPIGAPKIRRDADGTFAVEYAPYRLITLKFAVSPEDRKNLRSKS